MQRFVERSDQRLHGVRILLDKFVFQIEHGCGVRAAENGAGAVLGPAVRDHLDIAVLLELGHHGVDVGERIDVALLHGGDRRCAGADADIGRVGRLQAGFRHQIHDKKVGG